MGAGRLTAAQRQYIDANLERLLPALTLVALRIVRRRRWLRSGHMPDGQQAEDLVQIALLRILRGTRRWPEGMDFVLLMHGTMRSIAFKVGKRDVASSLDELHESRGESEEEAADASERPDELFWTAEREATIRAEARAAAGNDPMAHQIIDAALEGAEFKSELAEDTGLTYVQVHAGVRRLVRHCAAVADAWGEDD